MKKLKKSLALVPVTGTLMVGAFLGTKTLNNNNNIYNQPVTEMLQANTKDSVNIEADNNWITLEEAYTKLWDKIKNRLSTVNKVTIELNQNIIFNSLDADDETATRNFEQTILAYDSDLTEEDIYNKFKNIEIDMNGHVLKSEINIDQYLEQDIVGGMYIVGETINHSPYMFNKLEKITFKNGTFVNTPLFANEVNNSKFINTSFVDMDVSDLGYNEAEGDYALQISSDFADKEVNFSLFANNIAKTDFVNTSFENIEVANNSLKFESTSTPPSAINLNLLANGLDASNFINTSFLGIAFIENLLSFEHAEIVSTLDVFNKMQATDFNNFIFNSLEVINNTFGEDGAGTLDYALINEASESNILDFSFSNWTILELTTSPSSKAEAPSPALTRGYVDESVLNLFTNAGLEVSADLVITQAEIDAQNPDTIAKVENFANTIWSKAFNDDGTVKNIALNPFVNLNQVDYLLPMITTEENTKATFAPDFTKSANNDEISVANQEAMETAKISVYDSEGEIDFTESNIEINDDNKGFSTRLTYDANIFTSDVAGTEKAKNYEGFDTYTSNHVLRLSTTEEATQKLAKDNTYAGLLYSGSFSIGNQITNNPKPENYDIENGIDFSKFHYAINFEKLDGDVKDIIISTDGNFNKYDLNEIFSSKSGDNEQKEANLNLTLSLNSTDDGQNFNGINLGNLLNPAISNDSLSDDAISKFNVGSVEQSTANISSRLQSITSLSGDFTLENLTNGILYNKNDLGPKDNVDKVIMDVINGGKVRLNSKEVLPEDSVASKVNDFNISQIKERDNKIDVVIKTEMDEETKAYAAKEDENFTYVIHYVVLNSNDEVINPDGIDASAQVNSLETVISIGGVSKNQSVVISNISLMESDTVVSSKMTYIKHKFTSNPPKTRDNSTYIVITTMSVLLLVVLLVSMIIIFRTSSKNKVLADGSEDDIDYDSDEI